MRAHVLPICMVVSLAIANLVSCGGTSESATGTITELVTEPIVWEIGKPGGKLTFTSISPPKSFNTITANETSSSVVLGFIYNGLTEEDPVSTEVAPCLAESWDVSEDGLAYTFHLRKDVKWNDGQPLTAEDVEFTFNELIFNEDIRCASRDIFVIDGKKLKVTAVDKHTARFELPTKFAPFLRSLGTSILPKHSLKSLVDEGKFNHSLGVDAEPSSIIGTGPFVLDKYVTGQRVVLKRNPHYWKRDEKGGQLPYLNEVVIQIVQSQEVEVLRFKQKEIDYLGVRGVDYPNLAVGAKTGGYKLYLTGTTFGSQFLFFNQNTGNNKRGKPYVDPVKLKWFRNEQFRKAVAHAIDRKSMINSLMNGLGVPQWGPESPAATFFFNPDVPQHPYDIKKAKQILTDADFKDRNGDGIVEDSEGNDVEFSLTTNTGNEVRIKMAEMIRKDMENLGFRVHFLPMQFNMLVSKLDSNYDWEAMILGLTGGPEPHFGRNVWHSTGHTHMWFPKQEKPSTDWEARIDQIFDQGVQELDPQKRKALYDEWQVIAATKLPFIYTVLPKRVEAIRNGLGNIHPTAYAGAMHDVDRIYWK